MTLYITTLTANGQPQIEDLRVRVHGAEDVPADPVCRSHGDGAEDEGRGGGDGVGGGGGGVDLLGKGDLRRY